MILVLFSKKVQIAARNWNSLISWILGSSPRMTGRWWFCGTFAIKSTRTPPGIGIVYKIQQSFTFFLSDLSEEEIKMPELIQATMHFVKSVAVW